MVKQGIKRGGVLFIILYCILLVFIISFNSMAEKNSFSDETDWNTGIRTITQKSYATGWNESNSLVKWISVPKKSLTKITLSVKESRSRSGRAYIMRYNKNKTGGVYLYNLSDSGSITANITLYPNYIYKLYTYGKTRSLGGSAEGQIKMTIKPYFTLNYDEFSQGGYGQGTVKIYRNNQHVKTVTDDSSLEVLAGNTIYCQAVPAKGYSFIRWEVATSGRALRSPSFIMNKDKTVRAVFADISVGDISSAQLQASGEDLVFSWDDSVKNQEGSGIKEYQLALTTTTSPPSTGLITVQGQTLYTFKELDSTQQYYAWVRAVDHAGNISKNWKRIGPYSPRPPAADLIEVVSAYTISNNQASYQVDLKFSKVKAAKYHLYRKKAGTEEWTPITSLSAAQLEQEDYAYTDSNKLSKHGQYIYKLITENALGHRSTERYSPTITIPNIPADVAERLVVSTTSDPAVDLSQSYYSNEQSFTIQVPTLDLEGDTLRYQVIYAREQGDWQPYFSQLQTGTTTVNFNGDGHYQWYLQVAEFDGNEEVTTADPNQADKPSRTVVPGEGAFHYILDTTVPDEASNHFSLTNLEQNIEYSLDQPSKQQEVVISQIRLFDNLAVKQAYFWNGANRPSRFYSLEQALENSQLKAGVKTELANATAGITINNHSTVTGIPWILSSGADGNRTVWMQVVDRAGNQLSKTRSVELDTTPPPAPELSAFSHSHSQENGRRVINFTWENRTDDVNNFQGTYLIKGQSAQIEPEQLVLTSDDQGIISGSYQIDVDEQGANQAITIMIAAIDRAGNSSAGATSYTAYTKAQLGQVIYRAEESGYAQKYNGHFTKFELTEPGQAERHTLEYGTYSGGEFTVQGQLAAGNDNYFIDQGLNPHQEKHYRLVAYNNSDDQTSGEAFTAKVPNIAPIAPVITAASYPKGFKVVYDQEQQVLFNYQPGFDLDGDDLAHLIYWAVGTNPAAGEFKQIRVGDLAQNPLTKDELLHGESYTWYVQVQEIEEEYQLTSASERVTFVVDKKAPRLSGEVIEQLYTNQTGLKVSATDIDENNPGEIASGIARIFYQKDSQGSEYQVAITENENGEWEGLIDLVEGEYSLQVYAEDQAGNRSAGINYRLKVDQTLPEIKTARIDLEFESGRFNTYSNQLPLEVTMLDPVSEKVASGLRRIKYWLVEKQGDEDKIEGQTIELIDSASIYNLTLDLSGVADNREYDLVLQAEDHAGNKSEKKYPGRIYLDRTGPELALELTGTQSYGSKNYLADLSKLTINQAAFDDESGIRTEEYNIYSVANGDYLNSQWSDWNTVKTNVLSDGEYYQIAFRAINGVGNSQTVYSAAFIYDQSGPEQLKLELPSESLVSGQVITITAQARDQQSPITGYQLAIGLTAGGTELTAQVFGQQNGWLELDLIDGQYRLLIPEIENGRYYPTLCVTNAAGITTTMHGAAIEVDNSQEKLTVNDQGPYTAVPDRLSASWQYSGDKEVTAYYYRVKVKDGPYLTAEVLTTQTEVTLEELNLTPGTTYQFEVRAEGKELALNPVLSPGVTVDLSGPVIEQFAVPAYSSSEQIRVDWQGSDPESGIVKVEIALGSDYKLSDISNGWLELVDSHLKTKELKLVTGERYYPMFRLTNGAGSQTDMSGTAIIIDDTPPPVPEVNDHAEYINPDQPVIIDWTNTVLMNKIDAESGNQRYYWTYSTELEQLKSAYQGLNWQESPDLKLRWANIRELTGSSVIKDGTRYYFAVKVVNGAGLERIGHSDGLTIDSSAPSIPELRVLHTSNLGQDEEVNYINTTEHLKLWIASHDRHSTVNKYQYAYGLREEVSGKPRQEELITNPGEYNQPRVITLANLQLRAGAIYYFGGESYNGATIISQTGYSSGLIYDTSVPQISKVNGTASGSKLLFDWGLARETTVSSVIRYETALVTAPTEEVKEWDDVGLARTRTIDATNLPDGEYYLKVRAVNAAGNYSKPQEGIGLSPVVILDRSKPEVTGIEHDHYTDQKIEVLIKAADNLSGISCFQYALGSLLHPTVYSGDWLEVINQSDHAELKEQLQATLETEQIPHGEKIYLWARVRDQVDLWSDTLRGAGIIVDHQAPVAVKVTGPLASNSSSEIGEIAIEYADPESGVSHYRLSVAEEKGGSWLTTPVLRPIEDFNDRLTGLDLTERNYYLVLEVFNRVGLSTVVYSETPVTIDLTPPRLEFIQSVEEIVFNQPGVVEYRLSETAKVFLTLHKPDGSSMTAQYELLEAGIIHHFVFPESSYGSYTLSAQAVDPAGNRTEEPVEQKIRVNQPPVITFSEDEAGIAFYTTPGQPLQLLPYQVYDPDGGTITGYQWDFADGSALSTEESPEHIYEELGDYTISVIIMDNDGGVTRAETKVMVENSKQGRLYRDESWSGQHTINGDILVPEGLVLTILPGTRVLIDRLPGTGGDQPQLLVKGELVVGNSADTSAPPVEIRLAEAGQGHWEGIYIEGRAELNHVVLEDAIRAITVVNQARVKVLAATISNNLIGLHCYQARPTVEQTVFKNNSRYGIKEDQDGRPLVINCLFTNNGIDYYHQELSRLTIDEINSLAGNSANQGGEQ